MSLRARCALAAAIHWYERGEISQEKAARVAGLNRADFLAALAREKAIAFVVDFDDLKRELERGWLPGPV
jgi:predicted HTH domain antitoxin